MKAFLFCYGTLLPEHAPPSVSNLIRKLRPIGPATVRGRLYNLGRYPGAILDAGSSGHISGQVFALPADTDVLARLDEYEGFDPADPGDSLFVRQECRAAMLNGNIVKCWIYVYNRKIGSVRPVPGGRYSPKELKKTASHNSARDRRR
ncbi:MAG: gamma-glutamylcyclotransferase [Terriglobales bacterium]